MCVCAFNEASWKELHNTHTHTVWIGFNKILTVAHWRYGEMISTKCRPPNGRPQTRAWIYCTRIDCTFFFSLSVSLSPPDGVFLPSIYCSSFFSPLLLLYFSPAKRRLRTVVGRAEANRIMSLTVALPSYYVYFVSFFFFFWFENPESSCGKWSNVPAPHPH